MIITKLEQYPQVLAALQELKEPERIAHLRYLCQNDLYFLLRYGCERKDLEHPWLFERCREVQASPNGHLDLWAREHGKSSLITFGLTLQNILNDPEITVGIFSYSRPLAKAFLRQLKGEMERNENLKAWFPDILWENPHKQSPKWSEDDGIIVKRRSNPKEATVEGWGLIDGMPTGKHFKVRVYDDIVVGSSVGTPEMIQKTTEALGLSDNLGVINGAVRYIGTRYHHNDSYSDLLKRGIAKPRIYACTFDGTDNFEPGNCTLMPPDVLEQKRKVQGLYTFSLQMLLKPAGDAASGFKREWLHFSDVAPHREGLNIYVLVDPANSKKKRSDFTAVWVVGLGADEHYVVLDLARDKLNLGERAELLFELVRKWRPIAVGVEQYGLTTDVEHIRHLQGERNFRFRLVSLGGSMGKHDRIRMLMPLFEQGKIILPRTKMRTLYDRTTVDLIDSFVEEEYMAFPVAQHDDCLDCLARIVDPALQARFPVSPDNFAKVEVIANGPLLGGARRDGPRPSAPSMERWRPAWK